jgi:TolB-like protein/Tfp pilus assembly protein PilF
MKRCPSCNRVEADDALTFCRADGTPLARESGATNGEVGTRKFSPSQGEDTSETRILPTGEVPGRTTAPTAVLDGRNPSGSTQELSKPNSRKAVVLVAAALAVFTLAAAAFYFSRGDGTAIESVAVLPFENRSNDADAEYLSDGLTESLIYRLSQLPNLKVSPTSSVLRYKGRETDPLKIGGELGVQAVMTGRVAQRGENLNISVELVDVRTNKLLWGEQYERRMSELLATQREIAAEITNKLQLKLSGEGEKTLAKQYTSNNEAYQLYLKGRYHYAKRTKDDILKGIEYFRQAIRLDPDFALAYVGVSESYSVMPFYGYLSPKEGFPQAKAAAQRALEIDPTLAEAHAALAEVTGFYERDWEKGVREYKRAIELNPNVPEIHFSYGFYLQQIGRSDEAIIEGKRALEMEPLSIPFGAILVGAYIYARQNDAALEQARKTYNLEPNHPAARFWLSLAYVANGMYGEAIAIGEKTLQNDPTNQDALFITGYAYAKSGRRQDAEEVVKKFKDIGKTQYVMSYSVASLYAALGDKDKAFAELEKSFVERDTELSRLKVDPLMDPLRDDPRFSDLLRRVGLPQ